jgi:Tol biopolymer transport system component
MNVKSCFITLTLLFLFTAGHLNVYAQGLTPEDVISIETVGSVSLNSGGDYIAYTLSVPRTEEDDIGTNYSELYILPATGGDPVPVIEKPSSAGNPQWGTDGRLYFTSRITDHHDQVQVYSVDSSGNDLQQHTSAEHGLSSFGLNDDGSRIAYTAMDPVSEEQQDRQERGFDMIVAGENERFMRLWVQNRDDDNAEKISPDTLFVRSFSWAPNGNELAVRVTEKPGADQDEMYSRIGVLSADGSDFREVMSSPKKKSAMSWSPDGSKSSCSCR